MNRDRLVNRIEWAIHGVHQSWGWHDTAQQIADAIADLFPGEVESARRIAELEREVESLRWDKSALRTQFDAYRARQERKSQ